MRQITRLRRCDDIRAHPFPISAHPGARLIFPERELRVGAEHISELRLQSMALRILAPEIVVVSTIGCGGRVSGKALDGVDVTGEFQLTESREQVREDFSDEIVDVLVFRAAKKAQLVTRNSTDL